MQFISSLYACSNNQFLILRDEIFNKYRIKKEKFDEHCIIEKIEKYFLTVRMNVLSLHLIIKILKLYRRKTITKKNSKNFTLIERSKLHEQHRKQSILLVLVSIVRIF
jgi:hypothetical protein